MGKKLFVGNLSFDTTSADLEALFSQAGTCESAAVITDRATGRSRGFGFVEMSSASEAERAITELNGHELQGRKLNVSEARERAGGGGGSGTLEVPAALLRRADAEADAREALRQRIKATRDRMLFRAPPPPLPKNIAAAGDPAFFRSRGPGPGRGRR